MYSEKPKFVFPLILVVLALFCALPICAKYSAAGQLLSIENIIAHQPDFIANISYGEHRSNLGWIDRVIKKGKNYRLDAYFPAQPECRASFEYREVFFKRPAQDLMEFRPDNRRYQSIGAAEFEQLKFQIS